MVDQVEVMERVEFRASGSWVDNATEAAKSLDLGLSAFIRQAVVREIERMKRERAGSE